MSKNSSTNTTSNPIMEKLLASHYVSGKLLNLSRGQQIEGIVVSITDKEIILDLSSKSEGVLPKKELTPQGKDLKLGDKIKVFVTLPENESGQVVLSTSYQTKSQTGLGKSRGGYSWDKFIQAQNQKTRLQGKVLEINKGGLMVEAFGVRGFLPNSQVGFELLGKSGEGMENLVGQILTLTVVEVSPTDNKLIFTQRGQISDETKEQLKIFKSGQKIKDRIVAILPFGLVVDIKGVEGLVFISDVAWEKVEDLASIFQVGQEVEAQVLGVDEQLGRVNLSIKHLTEDPFVKLAEKYEADEVVKGEIAGISEAGIAVKLDDGVEGFLPASKMELDTKYETGEKISFLIDSVDAQRRRVNLAPLVTSTEGLVYK